MTILRLEEGLGNQIFQYAFGRYLVLQKGQELMLDVNSYQQMVCTCLVNKKK